MFGGEARAAAGVPPPNGGGAAVFGDDGMYPLPATAPRILADDEPVAPMSISTIFIVLFAGTLAVYALGPCRASPPSSWIFLTIGAVVAILLKAGFMPHSFNQTVDELDDSFSDTFFLILLPPIIFQSGFELNVTDFFKRFWAICTFAFLGTVLSSVCIGLLLFGFSHLPGLSTFSFLDALTFGTVLSATDTVAVIAVFEALHVKEELYALVFGESVLNDAVAIVLFHTLLSYQKQDVTASSVMQGFGMFLLTFLGSVAIGSIIGVLSALLFKYVRMQRRRTGLEAEKALLVITPFIAYMVTEALKLSGVVAILFTGISMGLYTVRNITLGSRRFVTHFYRLLASLSESLAFVYIGLALPLLGSDGMRKGWGIALLLILFCLAGRGVSTVSCTALVNRFRRPADRIDKKSRFVIWLAGLRGGVAFALSSAASKAMTNPTVAAMLPPVTLFIILISMVSISGTMGYVIRKLRLQALSMMNAAGTGARSAGGADARSATMGDVELPTISAPRRTSFNDTEAEEDDASVSLASAEARPGRAGAAAAFSSRSKEERDHDDGSPATLRQGLLSSENGVRSSRSSSISEGTRGGTSSRLMKGTFLSSTNAEDDDAVVQLLAAEDGNGFPQRSVTPWLTPEEHAAAEAAGSLSTSPPMSPLGSDSPATSGTHSHSQSGNRALRMARHAANRMSDLAAKAADQLAAVAEKTLVRDPTERLVATSDILEEPVLASPAPQVHDPATVISVPVPAASSDASSPSGRSPALSPSPAPSPALTSHSAPRESPSPPHL